MNYIQNKKQTKSRETLEEKEKRPLILFSTLKALRKECHDDMAKCHKNEKEQRNWKTEKVQYIKKTYQKEFIT